MVIWPVSRFNVPAVNLVNYFTVDSLPPSYHPSPQGDIDGRFSLGCLPVGKFRISISHPHSIDRKPTHRRSMWELMVCFPRKVGGLWYLKMCYFNPSTISRNALYHPAATPPPLNSLENFHRGNGRSKCVGNLIVSHEDVKMNWKNACGFYLLEISFFCRMTRVASKYKSN